jgi:hypothetical protein
MREKLSALIEVRKITALLVVLLFITLSLMKVLEVNFIQTVIISVVSYYFGKSTALDVQKGERG